MLYQGYQAWTDAVAPFRTAAQMALGLKPSLNGYADWAGPRFGFAFLDVFAHARVTHSRPPFGIASVPVGNRELTVREEIAASLPFGNLIHFAKDDLDTPQPKMLVSDPAARDGAHALARP